MLLLLSSAALAVNVLHLDIHPVGQPPQRCTVSGFLPGELLAGPALQMGEAAVQPLVEVVGITSLGMIYWRTALKVTQPGLISIARTDDRRDPAPAPPGRPVAEVFNRAEQTVRLEASFFGGPLPVAPSKRPVWDATSWYRPAREMACGPLPAPVEATE